MRLMVLESTHDALIGGGHLGIEKTYSKITERYWWPGVYQDVKHHVTSCTTCGTMFRSNSNSKGSLQSIVVHEPFELVGMDIVGKLPTTSHGNKFILVITDYLSKWATAVALSNITSSVVAEALIQRVILAGHGIPACILTDRASNFNSALAREIYQMLNIAKSSTSAYHPCIPFLS